MSEPGDLVVSGMSWRQTAARVTPAQAFQMLLDYLFIEPPWWSLLRALGGDPVRDGIDEFGSWMARNIAASYRPEVP